MRQRVSVTTSDNPELSVAVVRLIRRRPFISRRSRRTDQTTHLPRKFGMVS